MTRFPALLLAVALLALAPGAHASTASLAGSTITVVGGDESSSIDFGGGFYYHVNDAAGITAGAGCEQLSATTVRCGSSSDYALTAVNADLGGGDDTYTLVGCYAQTVNGGPGNDTIYTGCLDDVVRGGDGSDYLSASDGVDQVNGDAGNDEVRGHNGSDEVTGGSGRDLIYGDGGTSTKDGGDTIHSRDGEQDQVSCGFGADVVEADGADVVESAEFCETVDRGSSDPPPGSGDDDTAPTVGFGVKARFALARATRKPGLVGRLSVDEGCTARYWFTISRATVRKYRLGRRAWTLDRGKQALAAGSYGLGVWDTGTQARKLRALSGRPDFESLPARVRVTCTDAAGNWNERVRKVTLTG